MIVNDLDQKLENKIPNVSEADSRSLAAHVVLYKVLGQGEILAKACMVELAKRRTNGEEFSYETFIEDEVNKMPKLENNSMGSILTSKFLKQILNRKI